ncbi:MAG: glycosyltransferase family 4 protein [Acidobacteriota bacterium]
MTRPPIDLVSPLPPVRSGISDYCVDLLPELSARADVRLVRLPGQPLDHNLAERWPTVDVETWRRDGRLSLYQMGNNRYHREVWRLAMERPGVLVLHDLVLHHFLIDRTIGEGGDHDAYRRELEACHGWVGDLASLPLRWPAGAGQAAQFSLPAHRSVLEGQLGVLTHSRWAADVLREEMPGLRVTSLAMGMPLPDAADGELGRDFRIRHGLPLDRPVIGSFGFQTPIKRTQVAIQALASPELRECHLMVAGEVAPALDLEDEAARLGVADRVHVLGFLPFGDFEAGIAAADIALNLRYPTAGETSASLLRILAVGRPVIVSDYAQSADLPESGVIKVPPGDGEVEALVSQLAALLDDPGGLSTLGHAARQFIAELHRLDHAAAAVVDACHRYASEPPAPLERPPVPLPTSLAWSTLSGEIEVEGAGLPWPGGERRQLRIRLRNTGRAVYLAGERPAGGVALEIKLWVDGENRWGDRGWLGLPRDLGPGDAHEFTVELRRPLSDEVRLECLPHVLDHNSLDHLGGPRWTQAI